MFVSEAHSTTLQSRLAITLAWIAGYTNAVTLLACHTATSHMSGITSNFGIEIASRNWGPAMLSFHLLFFFVFGAMLSGVVTELGRWRHWESIYVLPMALQAVLLTAFSLCVEFASSTSLERGGALLLATALAAMAMGLQNATITRISRGVVRTTHVTGVMTDLGLETVQYLWCKYDSSGTYAASLGGLTRPTGERLLLLLSIVGSFALGAALGTGAYESFPPWAMFPPVLFLAWIVTHDVLKPIAEIRATSELENPSDPSVVSDWAVLRLSPDRKRRGHQRLPHLGAWSALLAPSVTFVILDLCEIKEDSENFLNELSRLAEQLKSRERRLLIVGYSPRPSDPQHFPPFFPDVKSALAARPSRSGSVKSH